MLGLGSYVSSTYEHLYSLFFDGTGDGCAAGTNVLHFGTADYSISLWLNIRDANPGSNQYIWAKRQSSSARCELAIQNSNSKLVYVTRGGGNDCGTILGAGAITALENTWAHIVISHDRSAKVTLYVNGTTDTYGGVNTTTNAATLTNTGNLTFGCKDVSVGDPMAGNLTDIAMFNVALDDAAVAAIYNSGKPFDLRLNRGSYDNSSALTGYWRCNDGSGSTLKDELGSTDSTIAGTKAFSTNTPDD